MMRKFLICFLGMNMQMNRDGFQGDERVDLCQPFAKRMSYGIADNRRAQRDSRS